MPELPAFSRNAGSTRVTAVKLPPIPYCNLAAKRGIYGVPLCAEVYVQSKAKRPQHTSFPDEVVAFQIVTIASYDWQILRSNRSGESQSHRVDLLITARNYDNPECRDFIVRKKMSDLRVRAFCLFAGPFRRARVSEMPSVPSIANSVDNNSTHIFVNATSLISTVSRVSLSSLSDYVRITFAQFKILPWFRSRTNKFPVHRAKCCASVYVTLHATMINLCII